MLGACASRLEVCDHLLICAIFERLEINIEPLYRYTVAQVYWSIGCGLMVSYCCWNCFDVLKESQLELSERGVDDVKRFIFRPFFCCWVFTSNISICGELIFFKLLNIYKTHCWMLVITDGAAIDYCCFCYCGHSFSDFDFLLVPHSQDIWHDCGEFELSFHNTLAAYFCIDLLLIYSDRLTYY